MKAKPEQLVPRPVTVSILFDEESFAKLEVLREIHKISRSAMVRKLIMDAPKHPKGVTR